MDTRHASRVISGCGYRGIPTYRGYDTHNKNHPISILKDNSDSYYCDCFFLGGDHFTNFGKVSSGQVFKTSHGGETVDSLETVAIARGLRATYTLVGNFESQCMM